MEEKFKPSPTLKAELKAAQNKASKPLLWIGIVSMIMFWSGLTSAYIVRADNGNWLIFNVPSVFIISTAVIITSSLTMFYAYLSAKKNNYSQVTLGLLLTLILGFVFIYCQYSGWLELFSKGIVFGGKSSNASGSFFILFVWAHWAHLVGGIISLTITLFKSLKKEYNAENRLGLELCSIYWHFLDILWVYLFLFLYFIR
jgi:cytochrome c oxidase subunit III